MAAQEFELIDHFFKNHPTRRDDVLLGIGDDAAVVSLPPGKVLVVAVDTLIEGVHFPSQTSAYDIGYKALAVNLSDLAAMGAVPAWTTLALTLPSYNKIWLTDFAAGFFALADQYDIALIGGDTTRGALSLSVQLQGWGEPGSILKRSGAAVGDLIYVSGYIGDAGLGLAVQQGKLRVPQADAAVVLDRLNRPQPRVTLGRALAGIASAAIDVSDGLAADLGHILSASSVGAELNLSTIPLSQAYEDARQALLIWLNTRKEVLFPNWADMEFAITAGDDYEICFTVPVEKKSEVEKIATDLNIKLSQIGCITKNSGLHITDSQGQRHPYAHKGYHHF